MNYKQIEEYILNIPKFRKEGNIEQTRKFYEFLNKPGKSASMIHVAGTNGKGSTCAYMNSVLTEAGYRVGMFTSPHLVSVRERIRISNCLISEQELIGVFEKLTGYIEQYKQYSKQELREAEETGKVYSDKKGNGTVKEARGKIKNHNYYTPTFYEFLFFMAMLYFEEKKVEVIILETGLGGRLDATNVIDAPKVAVITEIGMDHMEYLGDTFEKIAEEKAGIIKEGSKVIYSANRQEVIEIIERKASERKVLCKSVEKYGKQDYRFVDKKIDFSYQSRYYGYIPIILSTSALYQIENACIAMTAIEELELEISKEAMINGMEKCRWEGRMEEIAQGVFLDGAHNEDGMDAFVASVREDNCMGKRWLLFSAVADKEYKSMKEKLTDSGLFDYFYAAPLNNTRGITKEELENIFACEDKTADAGSTKEQTKNKQNKKIRIIDSAYEGFEEILALKKNEDYVYITGSLYLVGEIKERIDPKEKQ